MPRIRAAPVVASERERAWLESLVRRHRCPRQVALRARIIPAAAAATSPLLRISPPRSNA